MSDGVQRKDMIPSGQEREMTTGRVQQLLPKGLDSPTEILQVQEEAAWCSRLQHLNKDVLS